MVQWNMTDKSAPDPLFIEVHSHVVRSIQVRYVAAGDDGCQCGGEVEGVVLDVGDAEVIEATGDSEGAR